MSEYAVVVNAGSSSLTFSVFGRSEAAPWRVQARGQIAGIVTNGLFARRGADVLLLGTPRGVETLKRP